MTLRDYGHPTTEMCTLLIGYLDQLLRVNGVDEPRARKRRCVLTGDRVCEWAFDYPVAADGSSRGS